MPSHFKTKKSSFRVATLKKVFRKKIQRTSDLVRESYNDGWSRTDQWLAKQWHKHVFVSLDGTEIAASHLDHVKIVLAEISKNIRGMSVLELGSGNGFMLLAIAVLKPEIKVLRGIELTQNGVAAAQRLLKDPPVKELAQVTGYGRDEVMLRLKNRDIDFFCGDMTHLPGVSDNSYDSLYSCSAVEQLPKTYALAFEEAYRITKERAVFVEEFREFQNFFQLLHLRQRDYFRASFRELEKAGFRVLSCNPLPFDKVFFKLSTAVAVK